MKSKCSETRLMLCDRADAVAIAARRIIVGARHSHANHGRSRSLPRKAS